MEIIQRILQDNTTINILIGFFYSSLIGLLIFYLTKLKEETTTKTKLYVDLTKSYMTIEEIMKDITKIASIDGKEYRRYISDILDKKDIKIDDYSNITEFIMFDNIQMLPELNDYIIERFNDFNKDLDSKKVNDIINMDRKSKEKLILNENLFISLHPLIQGRIYKLNEMLKLLRGLVQGLSEFNPKQDDKDILENKVRLLKYTTDSMIAEAENLKNSLEAFEQMLILNIRQIKKDVAEIELKKDKLSKKFLLLLILCSILLIFSYL